MSSKLPTARIRFGSWDELARFLLDSNSDERGLFIRTASPPPVGTDLQVQMSLPDGRELTLPARVAYRAEAGAEAGIGVQLTHISAEQAQKLQELMTNPALVRGLREADPSISTRPEREPLAQRPAIAGVNRPDPRTPGARPAPRPAIPREDKRVSARPTAPAPAADAADEAPAARPPSGDVSEDDARLANALTQMDRSRFDVAERQVMDLLADDPADAGAQKLLLVIQARRLRSQFDFERAMQKYRAVLKLDPEHAEAKAQLSALGDELAHSQALFNRVFGPGEK